MIKKNIILLTIAILLSVTKTMANIPPGYYNSIDKKQNSILKSSLYNILKIHTRLSYNDLWYYYRTTDVKDDDRTVWDMYSNTTRYFGNTGSSVSGMNKEHSLPKSWWSANPESTTAYSDLNNLFPSDAAANSAKSNYILGTNNGSSFNNGVSRVGKNNYNFSGAPTSTSFEPTDEYKGDFARTYLYMITCYEDYAFQWRSDGLQMLNNETYPVLKPWAKDMLLKWHRNDPVSQKEINRNEEVFKYQNNRNPFIDLPQLVEYIWGDSINEVFNLPGKTGEPVLITPANNTDLYFGEIQKDSEIAKTLNIKGNNLTGTISLMLWGTNKDYFNIPVSAISASLANATEGYNLEITYNPKEYGEHEANITIYDGGIEGSINVKLSAICTSNTAIIPIDAQQPDVYARQNAIYFRAYDPINTQVYIYNIMGQLLFTDTCTGDWQEFKAESPGIYLISINGKVTKVKVN